MVWCYTSASPLCCGINCRGLIKNSISVRALAGPLHIGLKTVGFIGLQGVKYVLFGGCSAAVHSFMGALWQFTVRWVLCGTSLFGGWSVAVHYFLLMLIL